MAILKPEVILPCLHRLDPSRFLLVFSLIFVREEETGTSEGSGREGNDPVCVSMTGYESDV